MTRGGEWAVLLAALLLALVAAGAFFSLREREPAPMLCRVLVQDVSGAPLADADVLIVDTARELRPPHGPLTFVPHSTFEAGATAKTGVDGRAALEVSYPARWRVWASRQPFMAMPSVELVLDERSPTRELTLTLSEVPAAQRIAGTVVGPDGAPVGHASVSFHWLERDERRQRGGSTDADGRFDFALDRTDLTGALLAKRFGNDLGSSLVEPVHAGQRELLVCMRPREAFELQAVGRDGAPLDDFRVSLQRLVLGHWVDDGVLPERSRGAPIELVEPSASCRVRVSAPGFETRDCGPFASCASTAARSSAFHGPTSWSPPAPRASSAKASPTRARWRCSTRTGASRSPSTSRGATSCGSRCASPPARAFTSSSASSSARVRARSRST